MPPAPRGGPPPDPPDGPASLPSLPSGVFVVGSDSTSSVGSSAPAGSRPASPAPSEASSTPSAPHPAKFSFYGDPADHMSCRCPQHQGSLPVAGADWATCPAGHGFWASDARGCHICEGEAPTGHICDCEDHILTRSATLCRAGWPHNGEAHAPCHACRSAGLPATTVHERLSVPHGLVASAWHPRLRLADGSCGVTDYPGTCAVEAMAAASGLEPGTVWTRLCCILPPSALQELVPAPGLDERAFHAFGVAFRRQVRLCGVPPGCPTAVGLRQGPRATFQLTESGGVPHWTYQPEVRPPLRPPPLNRLPADPALKSFLAGLDRFRDVHGQAVGGVWRDVESDPDRAKVLIRELRAGLVGTVLREQGRQFPAGFLDRLDAARDLARPRPVSVRTVSGLPGCGKSSPLKAFLARHQEHARSLVWMAALPRKAVMDDWRAAVPLGRLSWLLNTYELAWRRQARVLILDELSLFPPGYLDLFLVLRPAITHLILLGDPVQCQYHNPNGDSNLGGCPQETAVWLRQGTPYFNWTHRSPQLISRLLGIPSSNPEEGRILIRHTASTRWPVICMTDAETKASRQWGFAAKTISSHQGAEYHTAQMMVHGTMLRMASSGLVFTAATRVRHTLILVVCLEPKELEHVPAHPVLHALLNGRPMDFGAVFHEELRGYNVVNHPDLEAVRRSRAAPSRAHGQLYERAPPELHCLLTLEEVVLPHNPKPLEPDPLPVQPRTHLPRITPDALLDSVSSGLQPREERELHDEQGMSQVFAERPSEYAYLTTELFPHQRAADATLYRATIAKRLTRAKPGDNERDLAAKAFQASLLFSAFLRIVGNGDEPIPFDPAVFAECVFENEFVKLTKKTQAVLANNVERSRPDWKLTFVDHFIKSQLKGKTEALRAPAKAGQTLATCSDLVVLLFGPLTRYMRRVYMDRFPDNIFCNCGRSQADQSAWARRHWRDVESTTSDYTGFDATQKGDSLGFEYRLMRHAGLPEAWLLAHQSFRREFPDLTDLYLDWKLNIYSSAIGPKLLGRDTGEPGTYDFNTYFNLALVSLMYNPPPGLPLAVGGDDLAANARLRLTARWTRMRSMFEIIAKVEYTSRPEFCGYYLTARGCYKNPRLLMLKTLWHLDKGDAAAVDVNYAAEATTAYALGDSLYSYCSWEDLGSLGWLLEYYHQHRPGLARHFFSQGSGRFPAAPGAPPPDPEDPTLGWRAALGARRALILHQRLSGITGLNSPRVN